MTQPGPAGWFFAAVITTMAGMCMGIVPEHLLPVAAVAAQAGTGAGTPPTGAFRAPASFEGELPCADCPGVRVHLDVFPDGAFLLRRAYRNRPRVPDQLGRWVLSSDGAILRLHTAGAPPTLMGLRADGILAMLDVDGQPIVSSFNTRIEQLPWFWPITRRVRPVTTPLPTPPLVDTTWTLIRLAGRNVDGDVSRLPFLTFSEQGRLAGSTGCNRLNGSYTRRGHALTMPALATTRMACATGGDVEAAFASALDRTAGMRLIGDWLDLTDEAGVLQARFLAGPATR